MNTVKIGVMVLWKVQIKVSRGLGWSKTWVKTDHSVTHQPH